jgi:undecaprenyl-diphosphatase
MRAASFIGSPPVLWPLVAIAVLALWRNHRHDALTLTICMTGAIALEQIFKFAIRRPRPEPFFDTPPPTSYSFPSGHALYALCLYATLATILTRNQSPAARILTWTAAAIIILSIGYSRIYLGVHYPTDVLGGYALAALWRVALLIKRRASAFEFPG